LDSQYSLESPHGRVAQKEKAEKGNARRLAMIVNPRDSVDSCVLRLIGGPTQARSFIWATRPHVVSYKMVATPREIRLVRVHFFCDDPPTGKRRDAIQSHDFPRDI
jgi:hypothetical protein